VLIERYTKIVLAQPGSPFPLQRLSQLYRERDGNLTALIKDFETRAAAAGPEQYAALVTLAGLHKTDGRADDAIKTFEQAVALKPQDPVALLALARLQQDRGDAAQAVALYDKALALQTVPADKEQTIRAIMTLSLDAKNWAKAKEAHQQLIKGQGGSSLLVRAELGRELFARAEYERAEAEFKELVAYAAGDNRVLAPALKDLGRAQAKAHKNADAIATLKRGLGAAGAEAAVRAEIYEVITEIYRADQQLPVLIKQLEDEHPNDFARLSLLGGLYEETGDSPNALATYKKALAINPRHIDLRLKVIRVLQSQGELDKAISEYEALLRAAPNNPQFVFEQCEALLQRGDRARAMRLLGELEARGGADEEVLSRLADFYGRIGENDRSLKVLTRLTQVAAGDPAHFVDLGDRYFQEGNVAQATQTWKRILVTVQPRARALSALGEVYLEHDMAIDALAAFKEAVQLEPANLAYRKQLASAHERQRSYADARAIWEDLATRAKQAQDKNLAREARSRLVTLYSLEKTLDAQIPKLSARFSATPPDTDAGRMLAEVQMHMRRAADAEVTLKRLLELTPGDADVYLALERVLVQAGRLPEAIALLEKLLVVEPKRARELYQRMAQYALQLYKDEDAIRYAARAVELNPDDAEGHRRLGEMYKSRQDNDRAIAEFRAAISKNDRLFIVYFELADLLLAKAQVDEADRLYRRVLRGAPDEELVARAARLSMQINLGRSTLPSLEQELLPIAIANPQRPLYRRLLVEIYGHLTFGLVQRVRSSSGPDAQAARAELAKIGSRAVKPLLDALADGDAGQQRIAIDVLAYVQNKNASVPLFAYAQGTGDSQLRTRAMVACGALRDAALLPKLQAFLFAGDQELALSDSVASAAAWAVARSGDKKALPLLRRLAENGTPEMRAYALLGLVEQGDRSAAATASKVAKAKDSGAVARAAAAYALGELGTEADAPTLLSVAQGSDRLPRKLALVALGRLSDGRDVGFHKNSVATAAEALFAPAEGDTPASAQALRRTAAFVLATMSKKAKDPRPELLPIPDLALDADSVLGALSDRALGADGFAQALVAFEGPIEQAAATSLTMSTERAQAVLDALGNEDGDLVPFVGADGGRNNENAKAAALRITRKLEPRIVPLVSHPDARLRSKAVTVLARSNSELAQGAMVRALDDRQEAVLRVALSSVGSTANGAAVAKVASLAKTHESWPIRALSVEALGRSGQKGQKDGASEALAHVAVNDAYAIVREAALLALGSFDAARARTVAAQLRDKDPEPRVRTAAAGLLGAAVK
jgi:tetratricopeptide (TPR) repeat protein/HEAT repeat protein